MSFFGLSKEGKDAKGQLGEIARTDKAQMTGNIGRANDAYGNAQGMLDPYEEYLRQQVAGGFMDPEVLRQYGQRALPGVDDAIARMNGRWDQIAQNYNGVPSADYTSGAQFQNLDNGLQLGQNTAQSENDLTRNGFQNAYGRGDTAYNDISGNLNSQAAKNDAAYGDMRSAAGNGYGGLIGNSDKTYGGLLSDSGNTFSDLAGGNAGAYGKAQANVQRLLPGGDLAAAKAARAYAPEMVNTLGRIRAAGIDPNSPQASQMIQGAERDRARGMDDSLSNNLNSYVGAQNELTLGQEAARRGLSLQGLANRQGLTQANLQNTQGLSLGRMANDQGLSQQQLAASNDFAGQQRAAIANLAANKQALDLGQMQQGITNAGNQFNRGMQNIYDRNNALTQGRNMGLQDWQNTAGILQGQNQQDQANLGLQAGVYNMGNQWGQQNQTQKNWAAQGMGNTAGNMFRQGDQFQNDAMGWGDRAQQGYGGIYQREAANAGWGTKMLLNAGLGAMTGGLSTLGQAGGSFLRGMGNGAMNGVGMPGFFGRGGGDYSRSDYANGWGYGG